MKVISTTPDGSASIEFENLVRQTEVVGDTEPIRALISISSIPDLIRTGQKARRAGQRMRANLAKMAK